MADRNEASSFSIQVERDPVLKPPAGIVGSQGGARVPRLAVAPQLLPHAVMEAVLSDTMTPTRSTASVQVTTLDGVEGRQARRTEMVEGLVGLRLVQVRILSPIPTRKGRRPESHAIASGAFASFRGVVGQPPCGRA